MSFTFKQCYVDEENDNNTHGDTSNINDDIKNDNNKNNKNNNDKAESNLRSISHYNRYQSV